MALTCMSLRGQRYETMSVYSRVGEGTSKEKYTANKEYNGRLGGYHRAEYKQAYLSHCSTSCGNALRPAQFLCFYDPILSLYVTYAYLLCYKWNIQVGPSPAGYKT
jgi:hypothetical protein